MNQENEQNCVGTYVRQAIRLLGPLGTVATSSLHSLRDTQRIEYATNDLVANTWKVTNTTAAHKND